MNGDLTTLPDFHPQTILRDWGNGQAFHVSDALTGVCVFGATGSGKTSGGVFGIKNTRETSPVSSAFKNASFGEFQQILAGSGELLERSPVY